MNRAERRRLEKQAKKARKGRPVPPSDEMIEKSYELYNQALAHQNQGNASKAIDVYQQALKLNPEFPEALNNLANLYESQGEWQKAESSYRRALKVYTDNPTLLNNLGNALRNLGRLEEAEEYLARALEIEPDNAMVLNNLANTWLKQEKTDKAIALFEKALTIEPNLVETYINLASAHEHICSYDEAIRLLRKAIELEPHNAIAFFNLGHALHFAGELRAAVKAYQQAVLLRPEYTKAHLNLGITFRHLREYERSVECLRQAVSLSPDSAELYAELGYSLAENECLDEAVSVLDKAISLNPDSEVVYLRLGQIYKRNRNLDKAVSAYRNAIRINANYTKAYVNLGITLNEAGKYPEAIEVYHEVLQLEPTNGIAYINLAGMLLDWGRLRESIEVYQQGLACKELNYIDENAFHSNMLLAMNYPVSISQQQLYEEHLKYAKRFEDPLSDRNRQYSNSPDAKRKIRIGYVSQDFKRHSVAFFLQALLEYRDSAAIEVFCYSDVPRPDDLTRQLQNNADGWRDIVVSTDQEVAQMIQEDNIDILIDLSGHTAGGKRLLVFARKPAPVQVTYLGYPNTTGLSGMDYRLTDAWADPEGQQEYYTETLIHLPNGFLCYRPMAESPPVAPLPVNTSGHVTFGSFNNLSKVVPEVVQLWARVLLAVPGSRLIMKNKSLHAEAVCNDYLEQFEKAGVAAERIELIGFLPAASDHMNLYSRIDIGLDTFPYNGTTTTCEAMWMGVPVITLCGDRHAARVGNSLLHQVGLEELVAHSEEEYLSIAKQLADEPQRLQQLREGMRERMKDSPLCDEQGFTRQLEDAYRKMWAKWCEQQKSK